MCIPIVILSHHINTRSFDCAAKDLSEEDIAFKKKQAENKKAEKALAAQVSGKGKGLVKTKVADSLE